MDDNQSASTGWKTKEDIATLKRWKGQSPGFCFFRAGLYLAFFAASLVVTIAHAEKFDNDPDVPDFIDLSANPQYQSLVREGGHNGNNEIDFIGLITLRQGNGMAGDTRIGWWWLHNMTFSGTSTSELAQRGGLLWDFNDGDAPDPEDALGVFTLLQTLFEDRMELQLGKLYPGNNFAASDYWGDDRATYMSTMLSSDVVGRWFNNIGLGAQAGWFGEGWFVQGAVVDAQSQEAYFDFSSLGKGRFLWIAELGWTPDRGGTETKLSITPYIIDRTAALTRETGYVATFVHEWSDLALYGRYTWRDGGKGRASDDVLEALPVKRGGFLGLAWNRPFNRTTDQLAFAIMQGTPSDQRRTDGFDSQAGVEIYWAIQPKPWFIVTPDLQWVKNKDGKMETIFGLRLKLRAFYQP